MDTKPESLSKCINKLSLCIQRDNLEKCHEIKYNRLKNLLRSEQIRFREMVLLKNVIESRKYGYLVAIEYLIDDGSYCGQTGDALFYDGNTIYAVECKLIQTTTHDLFKSSRRDKVYDQALVCARRIKSWLHHLGSVDERIMVLNDCNVLGIALTDEGEFQIKKKDFKLEVLSCVSLDFLKEYEHYF